MRKQNKRHRKIRKCIEGPNFSGQHLLHNKKIVEDVINRAQITKKDTVMEIGAGKGAFTLPLAEKAGKVLAVENDKEFVEILKQKTEPSSNVKIIAEDFLKCYLPKEPFSVVASIPYAITTPIMEKLLHHPGKSFKKATIVMEKGAAMRFTATPITNPKILKWRMWFDLKVERFISRTNFSPPPKVDSAVLCLRKKTQPSVPQKHHQRFQGLADYALQHPKLPFHEALKSVFTSKQIKHITRDAGIERFQPISSLDEYQWGTVFNAMIDHVEPVKWPKKRKTGRRGRG
ncbi:23S ribosomal RNA methyltransferase Erm [Bacillus gobiensis]|uniref:23S ribosomal RNA methyltransferase Erm n=1 Tax=Bacillus gobiensis TaxID=1441095 RepID=UPI003D2023D7